jgi:hypothetical protein
MRRARSTKTPTASPRVSPVPRPPAPEVITGIALTVNGRELAVRVGERIRWHRERGDNLIEQMKKLAEVERSAAEDLETILGRYESPRAILEKRLRQHQDRAAFLTFVRDHITPDAVYRLDSADLKMIDVLPPW